MQDCPDAAPHSPPETPRAWPTGVILGLVFAVLTLAYVGHPPGRFTLGGRVHGDGTYTYVYLRSLLFDRDVDFTNDYALLGNPHRQRDGVNGWPENRFTVGSAILWLPTGLAALVFERAERAITGEPEILDGTSRRFQRITLFGSVVWGFAAIVLTVALAGTMVSPSSAWLAGAALAAATPLAWYMVMQPSWSHACSAFAVAAFVFVWHRGGHDDRWRFVKLGALAGLMALVRPQDFVFTILVAWELGVRIVRAIPRRARSEVTRTALDAGVFLGIAALVFLPQMLIWYALYGAVVVIPQGESFMRWGASKPIPALMSGRNGLFSWTPIVYVGVIGLVAFVIRRRGPARTTAALLLAAFVGQAYINGATDDWAGGWAFGGRRFLNCTIAFGLGLAYVIDGLQCWLRAQRRCVAAAVPAFVVMAFSACNLSYMTDYFRGDLERDLGQPMAPASRRFVVRLVDGFYRAVGHPGAIPVNWWFAWWAGVSPDHYDSTAGQELGPRRVRSGRWDKVIPGDARWSMRGFGPRSTIGDERASWLDGREGGFVLPVRKPAALDLYVRLWCPHPDARVRITIGDTVVLEQIVDRGWKTYAGHVPATALWTGLNAVTIEQIVPAPVFSIPVGRTAVSSPLELSVRSDVSQAEAPLSFEFGAMHLDVVDRGATVFAVAPGDLASARLVGTFDTAGDPHDGDRLARALDRLDAGTVVVLGLAGPATLRWTEAADRAIARLGGAERLAGAPRGTSYALIGVQGAVRGTAVEVRAPQKQPAHAWIGRDVPDRHDGVAWAWIVLADPGTGLPEALRVD